MSNLRVGDVMAWFPGLEKQLRQIPSFWRSMENTVPGWPWVPLGSDLIPLEVSFLAAAGLQKALGRLGRQVEDVLAKFADIEFKADLARAIEKNWAVKLVTAAGVVFSNDAGQVSTLPLDLVRVLAKKHLLDAAEVFADCDSVVVMGEEGEIASIPLSLWVCLEEVLERCPFDLENL